MALDSYRDTTRACSAYAFRSTQEGGYEASVDALGREGFSRALFEWVNSVVPIDEISGFVLGEKSEPSTIVSCGVDGEAFRRASLYRERYFRLDPFRKAYRLIGDGRAVRLKSLSSAIADPSYRHECFERPRLREKLSFLRRTTSGEHFIFSIYRASGRQTLSMEEEQRLSAVSDLVMPLLGKHAALVFPAAGTSKAREIEVAVKSLEGGLTEREQQVLARTLIGETAESIGRALGIRATTVLTYRRRAYARFGVSSANQLIPRLLQ
ncbi:MAG TPA: LuxR C-terminal-related transcriptional regulator [Parvularculaceae bacterium]|nr:LuxR C-terminal-related transcriptional regulator [Parvularculaceae bacterium]